MNGLFSACLSSTIWKISEMHAKCVVRDERMVLHAKHV